MGVHQTFKSILDEIMPLSQPRATLGTVGPDEPEITGDPTPDDDTDCAVEGIAQPSHDPDPNDAVAWRVAMVMRLRTVERAIRDVNDHLQVHRIALNELERQGRKQREQIADLQAQVASLATQLRTVQAAA